MSVRFKLDTKSYEKALAAYMANSKRDLRKVLEMQARGIIGRVIGITPPFNARTGAGGSGQLTGGKAKQQGQRAVERDVRRAVQGVPQNQAETSDAAAAHESARREGVVRRRAAKNKVKVPREVLRRYIVQKKTHVGKLAAGWRAAASKFGARMPSWVSRHNSPSAVSVKVSDRRFRLVMTNKVAWASKRIYFLQQAINMQRNALNRSIADYNKRAAQKAGFRVR